MMRILSFSAFVMAIIIAPAQAQAWGGDSLVPQTEARNAAQSGRTIPFAKISRQLRDTYSGELVDAAMYSDGEGGYHYKVTWMGGDGKRLLVKVDALSGKILESRGG
ncbi:PepSY domain-containing protein [Hirschia litorea]|uniref:PepSY domain-containing protein n=1 Tax=Hirschia litorea TaxID=1199156 RepID=A0ABW2IIF3_9PROT